MERDFLVTRILLMIIGFILVVWVVFWFLDEHALTSSKQNQVQGLMSPVEAVADSMEAGFPQWNME